MTITTRRIAIASLSEPISDNSDRNIMAMSTLIASDQWLIETGWDGKSIGDLQIFRNLACGPNGLRMLEDPPKGKDGKPLLDENGKQIPGAPKKDEWVWWGGVPFAKVKWYRFDKEAHVTPLTTGDDTLPFNLPSHVESKEESRKAGKGGAPRAENPG